MSIKKDTISLNNSQLKVMQLLWQYEPCTAKEITLKATEKYSWNKNTTYTILKGLVEKDFITRVEPDFLCNSNITLEQVRKTETKGLIDKLYKGSVTAFFSSFLEDEELDESQLEELKKMIDTKK